MRYKLLKETCVRSGSVSGVVMTRILTNVLYTLIFLPLVLSLEVFILGLCLLNIAATICLFPYDILRLTYYDFVLNSNRSMLVIQRKIANPIIRNLITAAAFPLFLVAAVSLILFNLIKNALIKTTGLIKVISAAALFAASSIIMAIDCVFSLIFHPEQFRERVRILITELLQGIMTRYDATQANNTFLAQINNLPPPTPSSFRVSSEIQENINRLPNDHPSKAALLSLDKLIRDNTCSITLNDLAEMAEPITVEYQDENNQIHYLTYEKSAFENHISVLTTYAFIPENRMPLLYHGEENVWTKQDNGLVMERNNTIIKIYRGLHPILKDELDKLARICNQTRICNEVAVSIMNPNLSFFKNEDQQSKQLHSAICRLGNKDEKVPEDKGDLALTSRAPH